MTLHERIRRDAAAALWRQPTARATIALTAVAAELRMYSGVGVTTDAVAKAVVFSTLARYRAAQAMIAPFGVIPDAFKVEIETLSAYAASGDDEMVIPLSSSADSGRRDGASSSAQVRESVAAE
jgi:hypothetical protein